MIDLESVEGFDWDRHNRLKSEAKHGVSVAEAEEVFFNEPLLVVPDAKHSSVEARYHALGTTHRGRMLHVTFTLRASATRIRVISVRAMSRKERSSYGGVQTDP